jgi:hypothetical protein
VAHFSFCHLNAAQMYRAHILSWDYVDLLKVFKSIIEMDDIKNQKPLPQSKLENQKL